MQSQCFNFFSNNIQTRAPLRSTPSAHEAMFAPSVSHAVVRAVSVAPFRAGSSRHRPRPARHVARPVRSASSSAAENENSEGIDALSDVTRAVLAFHAAERNGNGDRGRGGERTVPLESWAARYGWTVDVAERVLWQADVPLKSAITSGDANPIGKDVRIVDAKAAYVGVWLTFVEADHVVQSLLHRTHGNPNSTAVKGGGSMMKKQALDAAQKMLQESFKECEPEGGGHIARRSTVAAWGDITRALQRRYAGVDAESCPYAVLTKKVKNKRAYRAVVSTFDDSTLGSTGDLAGWEIVVGAVRGPGSESTAPPLRPAVESDAREKERGGFGVRAGIGASTTSGKVVFSNNIAARRAARAASWKRHINATYELDQCDNPWADEGTCRKADEARKLAEAAEKRRRSRLGSW